MLSRTMFTCCLVAFAPLVGCDAELDDAQPLDVAELDENESVELDEDLFEGLTAEEIATLEDEDGRDLVVEDLALAPDAVDGPAPWCVNFHSWTEGWSRYAWVTNNCGLPLNVRVRWRLGTDTTCRFLPRGGSFVTKRSAFARVLGLDNC